MAEPYATDLVATARTIAECMRARLGVPFVLVGASLGAYLAFEVSRALRERGLPSPRGLLLLSARSPQRAAVGTKASMLPDAELRERLASYGGLPQAALLEPELMQIVTQRFRADMRMLDAYRAPKDSPLDAPIHVIFGRDDKQVTLRDTLGWGEQTHGDFSAVGVDGGHLFFQSSSEGQQLVFDSLLWLLGGHPHRSRVSSRSLGALLSTGTHP